MNYLKRLLLVIGVVLYSQYSFACDCPYIFGEKWEAKRVTDGIKKSEAVFIGEVVAYDDSTYKMKVLDVFKGKIEADTLVGYNKNSDCTNIITQGMWIIYTNLDGNKRIPEVSLCSLSRSLSEPLLNFPPPPPRQQLDSLALSEREKVYEREVMNLHLKNWINEYAILNAYKNQNMASELREGSGNNFLTYAAIAVALLALIVAVLKK
jgi:hypothetical protein